MLAELPQLGSAIEERNSVMRELAACLEKSQLSLVRNDVEAIARGAAHQAELCRRWSTLETRLRNRFFRQPASGSAPDPKETSALGIRSAELQAEWEVLRSRIYHLARVHWSLLRHLERCLDVLRHVTESCAPTYTPDPSLLSALNLRLPTGE